MRALARAVLLLLAFAASCGDPATSSVEQELSACQGADGRSIVCYATDWPSVCGRSYNCNPSGYCPEAPQSEINYCANSANCGRPEYGNFCVAAPCPQGVPHFQHWCLLGDPP